MTHDLAALEQPARATALMLMLYSAPDDKPDITRKLGVSKDHGTSMFWMTARVGNSFALFEQGTLAINAH
jgi:hypothetical protein